MDAPDLASLKIMAGSHCRSVRRRLAGSETRIFPSSEIPRSRIKWPPEVKCPGPMRTITILPDFKAESTASLGDEPAPRTAKP